ncbi:MAG: hypothetical protein PSV22_05430 [Pseudolabrys sp.]|jgi:hypothetical protein|nr:hypothetical protein [Pseudolabrys sp.]
MSIFTKTMIAAGLTLALGAAAHASDATGWVIKAGQGYVVDMAGNPMIIDLKTPTKEMMARAKKVPRGTVFFMHDGKLMMVFDRSTLSAHY